MPRNTYFSQMVALDKKHAAMLDEARRKAGKEKEKYAPPMSDWDQRSELLATVIDEIRGLKYITVQANSEKGKGPKSPPSPYPRPRTAVVGAEQENRLKRHLSLAARVLPHKYGKDGK